MHLADSVGTGEHEVFVATLSSGPPKSSGPRLQPLDGGADRPVDHHHAPGENFPQRR